MIRSFNIPDDMANKLIIIAENKGLTVSSVVKLACRQYIDIDVQKTCEELADEIIKEQRKNGKIGVIFEEKIKRTLKQLDISRKIFNKFLKEYEGER
jgi:predicted DNA-binding protein